VNVTPFTEALKGLDHKPIVSVALAFDDPRSGETICLIIHQAIYIEEMENNLLCPMQMRMHDVKINECPRFLSGAPNDESHSYSVPKPRTLQRAIASLSTFMASQATLIQENQRRKSMKRVVNLN
jgi:hypothetical protein